MKPNRTPAFDAGGAAADSAPPPSPWLALFAGLGASLVAIGLARFAYTPLIPLLIHARWFGASDVLYLGAANFAGYFIGALCGQALGRRFGNRAMLRAMMALASLSFVACSAPLSLLWFFSWRFLSGLAGSVVMVLVAQTILPMVPVQRRGAASGAIFMGIGAGIVASATLLPLLLHFGLRGAWIGLGLCCAALTVLTWRAWPASPKASTPARPHPSAGARRATPMPVRLLYAQYAAVAVGLVPAAVFLVDFIARALAYGPIRGAWFWTLYGVGAMLGPPLFGLAADRIGFRRALGGGLLLSAVAAAGLAWLPSTPILVLASLLLGAFTPGVVTLMIGRLHELLADDHAAQHAAWSRLTTIFALFQALSGYAFSWLYTVSRGDYRLLYAAAAAAFALALTIDLVPSRLVRRSGA